MCAFLLASFYISQNKRHAHFWWVKRPGELSVQNLVDPAGFHEHKEPAMFVFGETWDTLPNPKKRGVAVAHAFPLEQGEDALPLVNSGKLKNIPIAMGKRGTPENGVRSSLIQSPGGKGTTYPQNDCVPGSKPDHSSISTSWTLYMTLQGSFHVRFLFITERNSTNTHSEGKVPSNLLRRGPQKASENLFFGGFRSPAKKITFSGLNTKKLKS